MPQHTEVFGRIYDDDAWTNGSGPGSIPAFNGALLTFLTSLIADEGVASIVDVGCGDFQLLERFDFGATSYLGLDVVPSLIQRNSSRFGTAHVRFDTMPVDLDALPTADVYLLKDVLIHLDNEYAQRLVVQVRDRCRWVMLVNNTTDDPAAYNRDITPGEFRPVDVSRAPFDLPVVRRVEYGQASAWDPRLHPLLARLLRRRVWPGKKHIQLVPGTCRTPLPNH